MDTLSKTASTATPSNLFCSSSEIPSLLYVSKISQVGGQKIPRTEKLTLGGARNLRGYAFEGIGPLIEVEEDGSLSLVTGS